VEFNSSVRPAGKSAAGSWARALGHVAHLRDDQETTLARVIDDRANRAASQPALAAPEETLTYGGLRDRKNQYARWALQQGLKPGDTICLVMQNRPEYAAIWIGLTQIGCVVALINTNLRGAALAQAIGAAAPRAIIAGAGYMDAVAAAPGGLAGHATLWSCTAGAPLPPGAHALDAAGISPEPLAPHETPRVLASQTALLIYTSGTTGLPKAARISHYRVLEWSFWFAGMMDAGPGDRLYDCLPMYHSTGGVAGLGAMLVSGGTVEVRARFSASTFWADVAQTRCTLFLYIGELCRYLLATPPAPAETAHALRLCVGNGLGGDIWTAFAARFHVPRILEFYASTEGNISLYNCEGRPGAIGRVPAFMAHRFPVALIACDPHTGEPQRGPDGKCLRCAPGQPGEAIGAILSTAAADPTAFEGYTDAAASGRKILRNVFKDGDAWFRSGDLLMQDTERFFYFVDRIGDTWRWKGENVSATQVAEALRLCHGVTGAVAFGVRLAAADGRAGMAAITVTAGFDAHRLHADIAARLPAYARPMFVRVCAALEITGTFKTVKTSLVREGYDLGVVRDPVYIDDPAAGTYRRLGRGEARRLMGIICETDASAAF
jgi:fatty-acyl-CoA synthase